ncbi:hypothetical protein V1281_006947 [Nitrobacteraceae bacterium AZCC 2161]
MPRVNRKLELTFSRAEIESILADRARDLMLKRPDVKKVELETVADVEGQAIVTLYVREEDVEMPMGKFHTQKYTRRSFPTVSEKETVPGRGVR